MVGYMTLNHVILVRIQVPQPFDSLLCSWLREMRKLLYAYLGFEQRSLCNVVTLHASGWLDKLSNVSVVIISK